MHVLVLSASNWRGAFAATRRLHGAGWTVSAGAADTEGPLSWTKATDAVYPVPAPEHGVDEFLAAVAAAVKASGAEVVLPSDDADMIALSWGRDRIPAIVPLAPHDAVLRLVDKLELVRAARELGLAIPETRVADDKGFQETSYPVVVKSRFHWLPEHTLQAPARLAATLCCDRASAVACADGMRRFGAVPLLQEFIDGTPVYVHLVSDRFGTVLALDQQEGRERLFYPPGSGVRTRSVTVETDPILASGVNRLIGDSKWFGFAGVTFLRGDDGVQRVIDFNGRIPASLEASAGAGPNYIAAWAELALDERTPILEAARIGTRFQWLEGDLGRAYRERQGGLLRDVAGTLAYSLGATHTMLKRDEPLVAIRQASRLIRQRMSRMPRP